MSSCHISIGFLVIGVAPHRYQAKKSKYPKTKKLASLGENVHFFVLGVLQNVGLMGI